MRERERWKVQTRKGQSIEDASMAIIEAEVGHHGYDKAQWPIVRRVIHSTADFDFAGRNGIIFSENAIRDGITAIGAGCDVVADVHGVAGLLSRRSLQHFGVNVACKISNPEIAEKARLEDTTRSQASMRASAEELDGGIAVIGNAPTALLELIRMVREGTVRPALVIGMPVGFVSAAESKEELAGTAVEHITNRGRKGGSPSAAAALNALLLLALESPP